MAPQFTCVVPDFQDIRVEVPLSSVPVDQDFTLTIKVQENPANLLDELEPPANSNKTRSPLELNSFFRSFTISWLKLGLRKLPVNSNKCYFPLAQIYAENIKIRFFVCPNSEANDFKTYMHVLVNKLASLVSQLLLLLKICVHGSNFLKDDLLLKDNLKIYDLS